MTQTKCVLEHLQKYGAITSMEAFDNYGITRLSAKVFDLKKEGYSIETVRRKCKNRFGHTCVYGEYVLHE